MFVPALPTARAASCVIVSPPHVREFPRQKEGGMGWAPRQRKQVTATVTTEAEEVEAAGAGIRHQAELRGSELLHKRCPGLVVLLETVAWAPELTAAIRGHRPLGAHSHSRAWAELARTGADTE